jgi:hypothetical protein
VLPYPIVQVNGSWHIPAEVDLRPADLIAYERQDLCVPAFAAGRLGHLVGHDGFVADLDQPHEVELLTPAGAWPAALEVTGAIQADIERT